TWTGRYCSTTSRSSSTSSPTSSTMCAPATPLPSLRSCRRCTLSSAWKWATIWRRWSRSTPSSGNASSTSSTTRARRPCARRSWRGSIPESIRRSGLRGYYGVPLLLGEHLIGVATIGSASTAEFSDEDRLLFRTMSARAAALIAQAHLNAELARRNAELANALEYRDRILGVLRHDLRNPLGVILMSAELLGRGGPLSARQQRSVR